MKKFIIINLFGILLLGCSDHTHNDQREEHTMENLVVELTKDQMSSADIKLGGFEKRKLKNTVKANGVLELPPQNKAHISPLMGGTIKRILVNEGEFVNEGQKLVFLQHPDFIQIQHDYLEARNTQEYLIAEYERKKDLFGQNISSGKEFQQIEMEYKNNASKVNTLKAKLRLLNINVNQIESGNIQMYGVIKSPIHGYVRKIETSIGSYVEPNQKMFEIVDNHHIHIDLLVYENDINKIKEGQWVNFKISSLEKMEHQAKIFAVGKAFEEDLKAVRVHAEIENPNNNLLPGMYVDARIITDDLESLSLPESALFREGDSNFIFIEADTDHPDEEEDKHYSFKKVPVKIGTIDNGYVEVILNSGADINSIVVVDGSYYLDAELNKGEAGHSH